MGVRWIVLIYESLTSQQVGLLRDWIDQGAHWPEAATLDPSRSDSAGQAGTHWAFLPVVRLPVPQVQNTSWVKNPPVHVHDLHATILHCLGLDHKELTYRHQGRDFRLTDVAGKVVQKMLA